MSTNDIPFPEKIKLALQPDAKKENKLLIAQGLIPLPPNLMIEALRILSFDADTEVQSTSKTTVEKMPSNILINLAQTLKTPETLDFLARICFTNEQVFEKLLINPLTPDDTVINLATIANEKQTILIANNQVRILRNPQIAESLKKNTNMLRSEMDRLISFLRMNGIVLEGESAELTLQEIESILQLGDEEIPEELLVDDSKEGLSDAKRLSIYQYIQTINTGQKIKLALKGNKEARSMLIKDSNKVISVSVIKNPRITDGEIYNVCQNRSISEEILRIVCNKPDWVKHYSVQLALVNNPKTPFPFALKYAKSISMGDLKKLSTNKNAGAQIQRVAKQLYAAKKQ